MKILLTADPDLPVPPPFYGGIERIIDTLAGQYAARGHTVLLAAHADSSCRHAAKYFPWPGRTSVNRADTLKNAAFLHKTFRAERPEVVHSFSRLLYLYPLLPARNARVLQSYQRAIHPRSTQLATWLWGARLQFSACASHLFQRLPVKSRFRTIYNFTDTTYYTPISEPSGDYLLFLGRLEPVKGPAEAVQLALKTNRRLILAGNIPPGWLPYFEKKIQPFLEPGRIEYVGPVQNDQKRALLRHAAALLFPICWEEPFGIVMAESLACGVPVLAFNRGAVPEVLEQGVNGFICESTQEMEAAIHRIHEIDRRDCRMSAEKRFSADRAAEAYLQLLLGTQYDRA